MLLFDEEFDVQAFSRGGLDAHIEGLSGGYKDLNEKRLILVMILFLFSLMLLVVSKVIPCRKDRRYRTPNNQPNSSLIATYRADRIGNIEA